MSNKLLNNSSLIIVILVAGAAILVNCLGGQEDSTSVPGWDDTCKYVCGVALPADTSRCPSTECRPKEDKSKPKILYQTFEDAVCGASYYGKLYPEEGNGIYKCPQNYGYHLTTHSYETSSPSSIKPGMIIDATGNKEREITSQVCR